MTAPTSSPPNQDEQAKELTPRMRQILDAAVVVTARAGLRGLTHRAVDAEAGLPQGSTSAYLRTRMALLTALADHVAGLCKEPIDGLAAELRDGAESEEVIEHAIDLFVGWLDAPDLTLARLELEREALRQPELQAVSGSWRQRLLDTVTEILTTVGVVEVELYSSAIISAIDGVLVDALSRRADQREEYVRVMARVIIDAFVTQVKGE